MGDIAVLVLAHKNQEQVAELCSQLSDFDVYIHVDTKSNILLGELGTLPNVSAISTRSVYWGSFAMVQATLDLMKIAAGRGHSRYLLISGQDWPIKSSIEISEFYLGRPSTNFVQALNLRDWERGGLERVTRWHMRSPVGTTGLTNYALRLSGFVLAKIQAALKINRKSLWDFYCGPQWMDLTGEAVSAVLNLVESEPQFLKRFRGTSCSDEIFFQTALTYLGFENTFSNFQTRYIDWKSGPEHPRTLRISDLGALSQSDALFARKVDAQIDDSVIEAFRN